MNKTASIIRYEYKMQLTRPAVWGILLAASLLSMLDNFPSGQNLARLEFLSDPAYFVYRIMSLDTLILMFGLAFLLSGRFPLDEKNGMRDLILTSPVKRNQYIWGKLIAGVLCTWTVLCLFLLFNTAVYAAAAPFSVHPEECAVPLIKAAVCCGIPVSLFVGLHSTALPAIINLRLFYVLAAVLFGFNAVYVGHAESMPFCLITSGDLVRLIWVHPKWPFTDPDSVLANAFFLIGTGLLSGAVLSAGNRFRIFTREVSHD